MLALHIAWQTPLGDRGRPRRRRRSRRDSRDARAAPPPAASSTDARSSPLVLPSELVKPSDVLRSASGEPVRTFALGGNRNVRQPRDLPLAAREAGVNYFFAYSMNDHEIGDYLDGLADLCADPVQRKKIFISCGTQNFKESDAITAHVERCLARLGTTYLDAFFLEYVCCGEEQTALDAIRWMRSSSGLVVEPGGRCGIDGPVRYVGCTTHDRCVGVRLLNSERVSVGGVDSGEDGRVNGASEERFKVKCELDLLMARYNMAHTRAEAALFPLAVKQGVPVIAFTSTRWNTLQKVLIGDYGHYSQGHPDWSDPPPNVADCMRFAAHPDAVKVVLNSPHNLEQLDAWVGGIASAGGQPMSAVEVERWREYGQLIYDEGAAFES